MILRTRPEGATKWRLRFALLISHVCDMCDERFWLEPYWVQYKWRRQFTYWITNLTVCRVCIKGDPQ